MASKAAIARAALGDFFDLVGLEIRHLMADGAELLGMARQAAIGRFLRLQIISQVMPCLLYTSPSPRD